MRHPEELLAAFVDGTATVRDRAEVEAHLTFCAICRDEVDLARAGRAALRSLPEVDAPPLGLTIPRSEAAPSPDFVSAPDSVRGPDVIPSSDLAPAPRQGVPHRPSPPSRSSVRRRWPVRAAKAMVAVAAVTLAFVLISHLNFGGSQRTGTVSAPGAATFGPSEGTSREASAPRPEQNYTQASLNRLALDLADEARTKTPEEGPVTTLTPVPTPSQGAGLTTTAVSCIERGTGVVGGTELFYLQRANYEGTDSYIGAFLQGSDSNRYLLVAAVSVDGCQPLRFIRQSV